MKPIDDLKSRWLAGVLKCKECSVTFSEPVPKPCEEHRKELDNEVRPYLMGVKAKEYLEKFLGRPH